MTQAELNQLACDLPADNPLVQKALAELRLAAVGPPVTEVERVQDLIDMRMAVDTFCCGQDERCRAIDKRSKFEDIYHHLVDVHGITIAFSDVYDVLERIRRSSDWEDEP